MPKRSMAKRELLIQERCPLLYKFGENLAPSKDYATSGRIGANEIFNALRKGSSYVDRVTISGSMGKRTALPDKFKPDFDLVVFCNNKEPPFNRVLDEFSNILMGVIGVRVIKQSAGFSLTVEFEGFRYDICPATNLASSQCTSGSSLREAQWDEFYSQASSSGHPRAVAESMSTGLAESNVHFLKMQDSFTHIIVRLAKYWNETLPDMGYMSGRSLFIETVAVDAAVKYKSWSHPERVYVALQQFLQKILRLARNAAQTSVVFYVNYGAYQVPVVPVMYDNDKGQIGVVLDPSNPYNNLAENSNAEQRKILEMAALATLNRLGIFVLGQQNQYLTVEDVLNNRRG